MTSANRFRVLKGETLFSDGEDSVAVHYLEKETNGEWVPVFSLTLEGGRSWGDEMDLLYRHRTQPQILLVHISGFGYWGDTEFYQSLDGGESWQPTRLRREPDPADFTRETLPQVLDISEE